MKTATISTPSFDLLGVVSFAFDHSGSDVENHSRRSTKTATLDGGAFIEDLGFTDSDKDMKFKLTSPTVAQVVTLKYLIRNYSILVLSCLDGCFLGSMTDLKIGSDVTITFKISSRLSAEP